MNLVPWTYKPPFRFTAIFITRNIAISSSVAVHGVQLQQYNKFVFGNGSFLFRTIAIARSWLAQTTSVWIHCSCPALWLVSFFLVTPASVVQSLKFFFPAPYRGWTQAGEKRVQDNLHAHAQNSTIFFPQIGGKTIFGGTFRIRLVARFSE